MIPTSLWGHESSGYERGTEADGARPPDVEPRVRATHVEAPPLDPDDVAPAPAPRAPFPRFQRPATPAAETDSTPDEDARTPQGERRSEVTEADDVEYALPSPSLLTRSKKGARVDTAARERTGKEVVDALAHFVGHHSLITFSRRVISSADINSPRPAPGQTSCVRCQAAGVARLLSQKGQVRHCRGRASYTVQPNALS